MGLGFWAQKTKDTSVTYARVLERAVTSGVGCRAGEQFCLLALLRDDLTLALAGWSRRHSSR